MKVKESDLVIGDKYKLDDSTDAVGFFVGKFKQTLFFYPTNENIYGAGKDGTIGFPIEDFEYEEA